MSDQLFRMPRRIKPLLSGAITAALGLASASAVAETPAALTDTGPNGARALRTMITQRLDTDLSYFHNVIAAKDKGGDMGGAAGINFETEVARAQANLPLLEAYASSKANIGPGHYLTVPPKDSSNKAYANLLLLLDVAAASEAQDSKSVLAFGKRVSTTVRDIPEPTRGPRLDPTKVYRELYLAMALADYREGDDDDAVKWFEHLGPDGDLQKLRGRLDSAAKAAQARQERLDSLHSKPIAIIPFATDDRPSVKWMRTGLADVVTSDVVKFSDVPVVERSQLDKVLTETKLAQLGVTDAKDLAELGKMSQAGTLLVGSVTINKADCSLQISVRLVDAETTTLFGLANGRADLDKAVDVTRQLALDVLSNVGFVDPAAEAMARTSKGPSQQSIRDLEQARVLMATKSGEAKALYAKAMREDPMYAKQFKDLQAEFKDVSSRVAVMPFANASGNPADAWMVKGISEALESDLPKMHFAVVEREQLRTVVDRLMPGAAVDTGTARELAQKVGADFSVVGSILHQKPAIRVDVRFVDIKTGSILVSATVENHNDDFMALLVDLDKEIAKSLNERLSDQSIEQLAAKKMTPGEFEKFVRGELAKDTLARNADVAKANAPKVDGVFWTSVVATLIGVGGGATSFALASSRAGEGNYYNALSQVTVNPANKDAYAAQSSLYIRKSQDLDGLGYGGVGLAAAGIIALIIDQVVNSHPASAGGAEAAAMPVTETQNVAR